MHYLKIISIYIQIYEFLNIFSICPSGERELRRAILRAISKKIPFLVSPAFSLVIDVVLTRRKNVQKLGNVSFILALVAKYKIVIAGDSS